jgi:hypothetical protein
MSGPISTCGQADWFAALSPLGKVPSSWWTGERRSSRALSFASTWRRHSLALGYIRRIRCSAPGTAPGSKFASARWAASRLLYGAGRGRLRSEAGRPRGQDGVARRGPQRGALLRRAALQPRGRGLWPSVPLLRHVRGVPAATRPVRRGAKGAAWRAALAARPSVQNAVAPDYHEALAAFLRARGSHLSGLMARARFR